MLIKETTLAPKGFAKSQHDLANLAGFQVFETAIFFANVRFEENVLSPKQLLPGPSRLPLGHKKIQ